MPLVFIDEDDGDVHFDAAASCGTHPAGGVSSGTAGGTAVHTDLPAASTSASPFGTCSCFALTFALLTAGVAAALASVGASPAVDVTSGEIPAVDPEHSQFTAQTAANRFFQEGRGVFAEGDFEAEYCVTDAAYDPPSVLPTFVADCGLFGSHLLAELGTDERAGFAALLEQHSGAFATVPGDLTTAAECRIPLRSGAAPAGCKNRATLLRNAKPSRSSV